MLLLTMGWCVQAGDADDAQARQSQLNIRFQAWLARTEALIHKVLALDASAAACRTSSRVLLLSPLCWATLSKH